MPASEKGVTNPKQNVLAELFGSRFTSHVEEHKSKDSLQSLKMDENYITIETDSKISIKVIDNRQNYENSQNVAHTKGHFQMHTEKTDWKNNFEDLNRISEMRHQNPNDIMNSKIQKEFRCSEIINKFENRITDEKNILLCSRNNDDLTLVKEAYVDRDISGIDMDSTENSVSFSIVNYQDKALDQEAVSDDLKPHAVQLKIYIQEQRESDSDQTSKNDGNTKDVFKNSADDETKYMTDIMESEKFNSTDKNSMDVDVKAVEEKQDVEKTEKCQEMAYAERQNYIHMLYSEMLSESIPLLLSHPLISSLPLTSSFLPTARSLYVEHQMYRTYTFESVTSSEENRLSQEWPVRRNFCFPCNIFASRQTNIPSFFISDEIFSQTPDLHKQPEKIVFHVDNKTCNLDIFSESLDANVFKISISQKCESKDVFELEDWNHGRYRDSDSICDYSICDYQSILKESIDSEHDSKINMLLEGISMWKESTSSLGEYMDPEYTKADKDVEKEEIDEKEEVDDCCEKLREQKSSYILEKMPETELGPCEEMRESEDSFSQGEIMKMETSDSFGKVESVGSHDLFDTLGNKTENNFRKTQYQEESSDYFEEDNETNLELKDVNELRVMEEDNLGNTVREDNNKSSYSWEGEIENNPQHLKKPAFRKNKGKKQWARSDDHIWRTVLLDRRWSFSKLRAFDVNCDGRTEREAAKCDLYQGREEKVKNNCKKFSWRNKCFQAQFSMAKNTSTRRQNNGRRRNIKNGTKAFERKSRNCMPKLFQYKVNQSKRQGTKIKKRNHKNYKWEKPTNTRKFIDRLALCSQKPAASMKCQHIWQMRHFKGCNLDIRGNPPIRLHLVQARVCTCSGGGNNNSGNYSSSGTGSANGSQGNGNNSAQRGNGSGRQNGSGSSSDGNGNNNNNRKNNNDGHNEKSRTQKSSTEQKGSKDKKKDNKTESRDMKTHFSDDQKTSSPSLPPPRLDPIHVADRRSVEMARPFYEERPPDILLPQAASASSQQERSCDSPEGISDAQISLCEEEEEEELCFQHAAVSIEQLCDIIGNSTRNYPSGSETFNSLNTCLTRIVHDLSLAADDNDGASFDNCSVCLVLSQLLIHMADPGHDGVRSCEQCSQIFNLIMQHCIGCIENVRPKSRLTQSDLCYKICKYSQWNIEQLRQSSNKLKGKVQKYCDKVLGNTVDMMPDRASKGVDPEGIGEIGETMFTDVSSTGVSSSTTLSLSGNIVTIETGDHDQRPTYVDHTGQLFANMSFTSSFGNLPVTSSAAAAGADYDGHAKLVRKPSHPRKTPAIPQPIPEDSQPESNITASPDPDDGRDDTERIIYRRMMGHVDPYETQRTYGNQHQYGSLQIGTVHDVEQFFSVSTQPLGAPGIGEVVFSHPPQLKIVAGFWDKKREECEKTQICPYQHREEGVILAEYKEYFGILLTRYQKHHQWERVSHLGNGMSGKCHLAIDLKTNFKFCCKKIHLLRYTEEELTLWSEMKNPYVVRLYGAIRHGVKIYIFSEFIDGGSLAACIEEQKRLGRRLSHWSAINYFQQLLKVLAFLQKKNILHEDIKADNILLRRNSTYLAVTDFGTSRRLQDPKELKNKSPVGSPTHWSPEKATMEGHGFPSDLWAAVCVLVHMLSGEPPWLKRFMRKAAILNFIIFARSPPMEDVPDNVQLIVRDLIEKGFVKDPQARPSSSELLQHPAFKILDEGTPETYFSTLTSMAHGLPFIQAAIGGVEQQNSKRDVPAFSTADSSPADATILYQAIVSTGPYQESDNRPDNKNEQPSERVLEATNPSDNARTVDQQQNEGERNEINVSDQSGIDSCGVRDGGKAPSLETQNEKLQDVPNIASSVSTEIHASVVGSSVDSKVRQLVGPLDIDSLLPQFNELFVSGDSISTQSIKSFFADVYSAEEFNGARLPTLQRYKPEVKTDVIPNLSIFDWEAPPATRQQDVTPESENTISNLSQIDALPEVTNPPIRSTLQGSLAYSHNTINFMLSSESDDCTSADLFEPAARSSDSSRHASNSSDVQTATSGSDTQKRNMYPLEDVSPTASTGSSNTSALQMRKPTNLILHCTPLPPVLSHSHSEVPLLSAPSVNEIELKHRANTWTQLSSSTHNPHHPGSTPSSSQVTSTLKKTNGASVPSTASSGHSQFSYHRSSVKEEQEKRIQELTTDMLSAYSPTSSDSDTSFFVEYQQQDPKYSDVTEHEDKTVTETLLKTMLEEMGERKLGGHNLKFLDDGNNHLFTMHIEELPANWRPLITSFRQKITRIGYVHFSLNHMNNKPVKYRHPLSAREFRVVLQVPGEQCWCQNCKPMY